MLENIAKVMYFTSKGHGNFLRSHPGPGTQRATDRIEWF